MAEPVPDAELLTAAAVALHQYSAQLRELGAAFAAAGYDAGLVLNAPTPGRLRLVPPLVLSEQEAERAVKTIRTLLDEVGATPQGSDG